VIVTPPRTLLGKLHTASHRILSAITNVLCSANSEKQADKSWGAVEGEAELKDEQAAAEIAQSEQKAEGEAAGAEVKEEEPEDKHITYDQYLTQLAEKKLALEAELSVRQPNEGVKDEKWKDFAPLAKDEQEELFPASGGKSKRERERKTKQFVELENRYIEPERTRGAPRGGARGGARGDGFRGDGARGRGEGGRGGRGRGAPRGEFRGEFRGGRGGRGQDSKPLNPSDESAFPSLGGN
jgi:plasminogen activator inhibitor 1 RNA-binding protein